MLDEISPRQFDEWLAYRQLDPDPLDRITEVLKLGFAAVLGAWGASDKPDDFDPAVKRKESEEVLEVSPEQAAAMVTQAVASMGMG